MRPTKANANHIDSNNNVIYYEFVNWYGNWFLFRDNGKRFLFKNKVHYVTDDDDDDDE